MDNDPIIVTNSIQEIASVKINGLKCIGHGSTTINDALHARLKSPAIHLYVLRTQSKLLGCRFYQTRNGVQTYRLLDAPKTRA